MSLLNIIATLAAIILALELLVVTVVAAGVCIGLWFGLRFADKKAQPGIAKANEYINKGRDYERLGLGYMVKPVILANSFGERAAVTVSTLVKRSREGRIENR